MTGWFWAVVVLLLLALLGWYLNSLAQRLDRLHHRVETSRAGLDAELTRRAGAAFELATSGLLDPASSLLLTDAATTSLDAPRTPAQLREVAHADDLARWHAESGLTQALRAALPEGFVPEGTGADDERLVRLRTAQHRARLARRFHNDAVVATRRLRANRVVRWGRLAGHARLPETADFDDGVGGALGTDGAEGGQGAAG